MHQPIYFDGMSVRFLTSRHQSGGAVDAFEVAIQPQNSVLMTHLHYAFDETAIGLDGIATWTVDNQRIHLKPGERLFVPRGTVHTYTNLQDIPSRMLCILTPGLLGPEYFQALSSIYLSEEKNQPDAMEKVMRDYGVIPVRFTDRQPISSIVGRLA